MVFMHAATPTRWSDSSIAERAAISVFLLASFFLACGESTVFASLNHSVARPLCPPRRAGDERGVRRWTDDGGNVCRNWSFDAARTEARWACGESPMVVPLSRSVARPLCPHRRAGDEEGTRR